MTLYIIYSYSVGKWTCHNKRALRNIIYYICSFHQHGEPWIDDGIYDSGGLTSVDFNQVSWR